MYSYSAVCVCVSHALRPPVFSCPIIFNPGKNVNRLNSVVLSLLCVFVRVCVSLVHMLDFLVPRSLALCQEAERRASRRRKGRRDGLYLRLRTNLGVEKYCV